MRKLFFSFLLICLAGIVIAQEAPKIKTPLSFLRYTDFHIHPTYKHYFRSDSADQMKRFHQSTVYDKKKDLIIFTQSVVDSFKNMNWEKPRLSKGQLKKGKRQLQKGETSDLKNYYQAGYPELRYVPGSILCNSYSPYEKQFALKCFKRWVSSKIVTKMGLPRLKQYADDGHTPFRDFLAEYYFNWMQREEDSVGISFPEFLYTKDGKTYQQEIVYRDRIRMVRDSFELDSIIRQNDKVFEMFEKAAKNNQPLKDTFLITTPMVMSIEGAQVLYDTLSGKSTNILKPFIRSEKGKFSLKDKRDISADNIYKELLKSVDSLRNLHHRLFFITLGHFAENHVVGFAKTIDRDPENIAHRGAAVLTELPWLKNSIIIKKYEGFNTGCPPNDPKCKPDSIGFRVVEAFLNPDSSKFRKPTYIDVKHMDIEARIQYYSIRREYEQRFHTKIPIIASHFAVSGENQTLAKVTGNLFYPDGTKAYFDKYKEIKDPEKFYKKLLNSKINKYQKRVNKAPPKKWENNSNAPNMAFNQKTYIASGSSTDPADAAVGVINLKENIHLDANKMGWYYPWSINLYDEEIIEINKSDGIIGLMLDPRQLGAFMPKYKNIEKKLKGSFEFYSKTDTNLDATWLESLGLRKSDISLIEYCKAEPLIRNIFYIIDVLKKQQAAEELLKDSGGNIENLKIKYPGFIRYNESASKDKDPWETIAIGGDFDGFIDPIDFAPTVSYIPILRARLVVYAYIFAQIHKDIFSDPVTQKPFIGSLAESGERMSQLFYSNGLKFIKKYF